MPFLYFDWTYLVFVVPCLIISIICSANVQTTYAKYSQRMNSRGMTGAQAAEYVLRSNGVTGVRIEMVEGKLSDHFDPRTNVIRLSRDVYMNSYIASVGVAAHEAGHAVQHAVGYFPNKLRSAILPAANIGSSLGWILVIVGLILPVQYSFVVTLGIIFYSAAVLFTIVTLPVEFNASARALACIKNTNLLYGEEYNGAKRVLQAAAMTYVASTLTSVLQLLRLIVIANNRRR